MKSLSPEEFGRLSAIFGELRGADAGERARALAEFGAGERPEVVTALRTMLEADDDNTPTRLDSPMCSLSGIGAEPLPSPSSPARIGPFEINGEIGSGAFGTVYRGRRREPFEQQVAVKVLDLRRGGRRVLAWFEREIAALSQIEHPGVAGILDAGLTEDGRPFLVTEFVNGLALDRYCLEHDLSLSDRLGLLVQLCDAVQHAHQRGVVHRDLKPTNVLVADRDGKPTIRVIDFGTAKLLEPIGGAAETLNASIVGTPGYLSPEQIAGGEVDARTDIYAIGVLLAEIITGEPVGVWTPRSGVAESSRVTSLPRRVGRRRRDFEYIVRTATAIDRERRYPSAAHIGDDLRAYLARKPLPGRSKSLLNIITCYARRQPALSAMALLLAAAVVVQSVRASIASHRLAGELRSQQTLVTGTLTDVVEQLGHLVGTSESRQALIDSLLARAQELKRYSADDPELELTILRLLAAKADLMLEQGHVDDAGDIRQEVLDRMTPLVARLPAEAPLARWHAEAAIKRGDVWNVTGNRANAESLYRQALQIQESALEAYPGFRLQLLDDICWSLDRLIDWGHFDKGHLEFTRLNERRLRLAESLLELDPARALSSHNLSSAEQRAWRIATVTGDDTDAASHADRAVTYAQQAVDAEPGRLAFRMSLIWSLRCSGLAHAQIGNADQSDQCLTSALQHLQALMLDNPDDLSFQDGLIETLSARVVAAVSLGDQEGELLWFERCESAIEQYGGIERLRPPTRAHLRAMMTARGVAKAPEQALPKREPSD